MKMLTRNDIISFSEIMELTDFSQLITNNFR